MRTAFGAVAGALAVGAMLVSYNLGERHSFSAPDAAPTTQMVIGPDGIARPYLVQAGQTAFGQPLAGAAVRMVAVQHDDSGSCRSVRLSAYPAYQPQAPYPVQTQYVTERAVAAAACVAYRRSASRLR